MIDRGFHDAWPFPVFVFPGRTLRWLFHDAAEPIQNLFAVGAIELSIGDASLNRGNGLNLRVGW